MEIIFQRGIGARFPFEEFQRQWRSRKYLPPKTPEELEREAAAMPAGAAGALLGHIDAEAAKRVRDWSYGGLCAVGYKRRVVYCLEGGRVVV